MLPTNFAQKRAGGCGRAQGSAWAVMDVLSSIITVFPGGDKFVVAKQTTGQWHVDAENPDDDVDLYESESRQQYAPVSEYLPTSAKNSKQLGGLEAMMAQVRRFAVACGRQRSIHSHAV
jgi:hypothetical protein